MASRRRGEVSYDTDYDNDENEEFNKRPKRKPGKRFREEGASSRREERRRDRRRVDISKPFKCRNCKAFIGLPLTGGRQRNHCPNCLYSLHVDGKTPGDRASDCRSLMAPAGTFVRLKGEQVLLHRCLACGFERHNRIAADDNPLLLMRLDLLEPRPSRPWQENEDAATA